eukprot:TRINITY_DN3108_c0_g1_i7.p2 TRINITY_DN3108_c0_g1~~TRINITY_DN3108_c0_g1_i7.p2  ORF type:complete len:112 (-),score=12.78 TRINITY_DN3108_c0_g1_i7:180-515(-)
MHGEQHRKDGHHSSSRTSVFAPITPRDFSGQLSPKSECSNEGQEKENTKEQICNTSKQSQLFQLQDVKFVGEIDSGLFDDGNFMQQFLSWKIVSKYRLIQPITENFQEIFN